MTENEKLDRPFVALIGAFNNDFILKGRLPENVKKLLIDHRIEFDQFRENPIPVELGATLVKWLQGAVERQALGGALFNTLRGISQYSAAFDIRVIGSVAQPEGPRGHSLALEQLGVDQRWISRTDEESAISICFEHDGGRTLLTTQASNSSVLKMIHNDAAELQRDLSKARAIHFNSFLDQECQTAVADLLEKVVVQSPSILISFDPGSDRKVADGSSLSRVISISSMLHLKEQTFKEIGKTYRSEDQSSIARNLLQRMRGPNPLVLVRRDSEVLAYSMLLDGQIVKMLFQLERNRLNGDQTFQTGDGQVFSGVFLASVLSPTLNLALSVKHATQVVGNSFSIETQKPECQFADATDEYLGQREAVFGALNTNSFCEIDSQNPPRFGGDDDDY